MVQWIRWGGWFTRITAGQSAIAQQGCSRTPADELPAQPERPWGCGWFDSSLDLREGLAVIEHQGIDLGLALDLMLAPDATLH